MTAGIAATRPIAVANSASAMCGPTVFSDAAPASLLSAMSRNANRMPITVPNRPMNGAAEPVVARNGVIESSLVLSTSWLRRSARSMFDRLPSRSPFMFSSWASLASSV